MKFLVRGKMSCYRKKFLGIRRNFWSQKETSCHRKKLLVTGTNFMPQLKISCHRKKYPNYRYFGCLLSRLTPAVSGEIFGWKYWFPRSKIFHPTLSEIKVFASKVMFSHEAIVFYLIFCFDSMAADRWPVRIFTGVGMLSFACGETWGSQSPHEYRGKEAKVRINEWGEDVKVRINKGGMEAKVRII